MITDDDYAEEGVEVDYLTLDVQVSCHSNPMIALNCELTLVNIFRINKCRLLQHLYQHHLLMPPFREMKAWRPCSSLSMVVLRMKCNSSGKS